MGFIAEKKEEFEIANEYYLKGLTVGDKLSNSVKILRGLANVSYKLKDELKADFYYTEALQKSIEMYGDEHTETALTYLRYGDFLSDNGSKKAIQYLKIAAELYEKAFGPESIDVSSAYYYIGNYYFRNKQFNLALDYFQLSLIAGFPGFSSKNIYDNPDIKNSDLNGNQLEAISAKALTMLLMYKSDTSRLDLLRSSVSSFNVSIKIIEMLRSTYQDEDSKLFISGNEKNTYSNALLAQVLLYKRTKNSADIDKAFSLSEKGKSAVLLSHLRDKEAKNTGRIPKELLDRDAGLKSEIYFYNKQIHDQKLSSNPDDAKIKLWNSKIFDLSRKQDELIKSIEKDYPLYYNMKYDNSVATIETIQNRLNPDQAIVEFSMTDSILFAFAITKNKKQVITTSIGPGFYYNLRTVREQLTGKQFNNYSRDDFRIFSSASNQLYNTLLLPLQPTIKGKDLILIPDGELGYLSFDILLTSMPDTTKVTYKNISYLIKESALTYAPSATTFFTELNLSNNNNNGKIIAFGPSYTIENQTLKNTDGSRSSLRDILSDLSNTQNEILSLEQYFNVTSLLGSKATEESFKRKAPDFKILHLAMHTLINNENSLYSKLVFFRPEGDTTEDGFLNASELVNMELHADMAVLSACNTGTGKMQKGEGIMSLSRDFFYAGVPGVVMTSWAVEDRTGIKLMDYFYKHIA
jgi:CHAT domain-containing protein